MSTGAPSSLTVYSWPSFCQAVNSAPGKAWTQTGIAASSEASDRNESWDLNLGWQGALNMLTSVYPWPAGHAIIERDANEQAARFIALRGGKSWQWKREGDDFDVALLMQGTPDYWLALDDDDRGIVPAVVHIVASVGCSADTPAETMARRFCAIAAAVLTLESSSIPVCLWTINHVEYRHEPGHTFTSLVKIKDSGQPLSMQRLAICAHPAYLRRLHFRLIEQVHYVSQARALQPGYGQPADPRPAFLAAHCGQGETVYLPAVRSGDITGTATALARLMKTRLGIGNSDDYLPLPLPLP